MNFDTFWLSGSWRKIGKETARTRFQNSVRSEKSWLEIQAARDAYNEYCAMNKKWYHPVLGSVWFGTLKGWRDWIPDEEVEAMEDDPLPQLATVSTVHVHHCTVCAIPHDWLHDDDTCWMTHEVICELELQRRKRMKQ